MTPLETFQKLAERLPEVFSVYEVAEEFALSVEDIELLRFNAEGEIIKASSDGADWILEKLNIEFEVVKTRYTESGELAVPRFGEWYIRFWTFAGYNEYYIPQTIPISARTKLALLNEAVPIIIEKYLFPPEEGK